MLPDLPPSTMPNSWLFQVEWLLLAAMLTPALVVRVSGQRCPSYYTVPSTWCTKNLTGNERTTYHENPVPFNCNESSSVPGVKNYASSVTLNEDDFYYFDLLTGSEYIDTVKTFAANITLKSYYNSWLPVSMVLLLEAPKSHIFIIRTISQSAGDSVSNGWSFSVYSVVYGPASYRSFSVLGTFEIDQQQSYHIQIDTVLATGDLHAFCYADNEGYIQTSNWNGVNKYSSTRNSCVTLIVPDNHVIMISFIGLDLETTSDCEFDQLTLHLDVDCRGDGEKICQLDDFPPDIFEGNISFQFITDELDQESGFRILYSFHPRFLKPEKLRDGQWNCSVPYFSEFQDHFLCSPQIHCSDGQDEPGCVRNDFCGVSSSVGQEKDVCYHMFSGTYSWKYAAEKCERRGAHLADPRSEAKLSVLRNMTTAINVDMVYMGFSLASSSAPEMYRSTWQWSDETLSVYLNIINSADDQVQKCGAMSTQLGRLETVNCDQKQTAAYVCQYNLRKPAGNNNNAKSLLPKILVGELSRTMAWCDDNHTAHAFLACDIETNCTAMDQGSSSFCAQTKFDPAVPFFTCNNGVQNIPYSLVCDHRSDCCDSSDEDFCEFQQSCDGSNVFVCKNKKQCIPRDRRCDGHRDCVDESDEFLCASIDFIHEYVMKNTVLPPAVVTFTNRSTIVVTALNASSCPETHFQCPDDGYCLPVYVLCNGVFDCPGKEDEEGCDAFTCPGFYRCRASRICLHHDHLCDGMFQCPQRDDELVCNLNCPPGCVCYGYAFICTSSFPADQHPYLRYLEASHTSMKLSDMYNNTLLLFLDLSHCNIASIGSLNLPNLQTLDLSYNRLKTVTTADLAQFYNLRVLSLAYNPMVSVYLFTDGLSNLCKLIELNLAGLNIPALNKSFLSIVSEVQILNLSHSGLHMLSESVFQPFSKLRQLDLRGCPLQTVVPSVFDGLYELEFVQTDDYKLCCPSVLPKGFDADKCEAPTNEVSSCGSLLRSSMFRVFFTIYAIISLIGNLSSFLYRTLVEKTVLKMSVDIFVTHLCVADFLMGVYLAIIGMADRIYYGDYLWNDMMWRHSKACKVAGFLSVLSSETSAFLICLITLEQFLVIRFPHKNLRFRNWVAHVACVSLWILGLLLATVPLLPNMQHWEFYSQYGICIPLPITSRKFPGDDYAFGILISLNFVLFMLIAVGQLIIIRLVRANTVSADDFSKKSQDTAIARRLFAVVMTNFLCWFPIGMLGILARSNVHVSDDVNVAMAIFAVPFSSAVNPFIYRVSVIIERRHKSRHQRLSGELKTMHESTPPPAKARSTKAATCSSKLTTYTEDDAWKLFNGWLKDGILSADRVRHRVVDVNPDNTRL